MELKNYMEDVVKLLQDEVLEDFKCCKCEKCMMDIAAIALNDLPPHYIVTERGKLFSKINNLQQQFEVDVISALTKAAVLVKRNPQHD